jgi:hypothetical protein
VESIYTQKEYCQDGLVVKRFDGDFPVKHAYTTQSIIVARESEPLLVVIDPELQSPRPKVGLKWFREINLWG